MTLDDEIRDAAQAIVRAFRDNDEEAYFAGFVAGRYWFTGGAHWAAIVSWAIGALICLALAFWWSSPVWAALPSFAVAFLLYWVWARATRVVAGETVELRHPAGDEAVAA